MIYKIDNRLTCIEKWETYVDGLVDVEFFSPSISRLGPSRVLMRGEIFIEKILYIIAYFARGHYANDWIYRYIHTSAGNIESVVFRREGIYIKIFFSAMETRIRDEIIFFLNRYIIRDACPPCTSRLYFFSGFFLDE